MRLSFRSGRFLSALAMAILLPLSALPAGAGSAMTVDGEPGKGFSAAPSHSPEAVTAPGPYSLSSPTRLDVMLSRRPVMPEEGIWCLYRITAYSRPMRQAVVTPGEEICMSCQEMFGSSPESAEFRFLDRRGKALGSAFAELVTASCGPCALEARQRFAMYRR